VRLSQPRYARAARNHAITAWRAARRQEGVSALWTGLAPNVARNAIVNATELATYDTFKEAFLAAGLPDNIGTHILSGLGAGFAAVCVGSPVDVVKSRMMGAKRGEYSNIVDCFVKTASKDGITAFYKGCALAAGPHT
jgi:solute carrier family 25 (mitochondrial uncoupling protein), member 8/9